MQNAALKSTLPLLNKPPNLANPTTNSHHSGTCADGVEMSWASSTFRGFWPTWLYSAIFTAMATLEQALVVMPSGVFWLPTPRSRASLPRRAALLCTRNVFVMPMIFRAVNHPEEARRTRVLNFKVHVPHQVHPMRHVFAATGRHRVLRTVAEDQQDSLPRSHHHEDPNIRAPRIRIGGIGTGPLHPRRTRRYRQPSRTRYLLPKGTGKTMSSRVRVFSMMMMRWQSASPSPPISFRPPSEDLATGS
jgi:hypothetical protein